MIQEEPFFLVNDFLEKRDELDKILEEIKKRPEEYTYKTQFLKNFVNGMYLGYVNKDKNKIDEKEKLKQELYNKKKELMMKIESMNAPVNKQLEIKTDLSKKDLILSKLTKKPIVSRLLDRDYKVVEPILSNADKILVESIKNESKIFDDNNLNAKIKERIGDVSGDRFDAIRYYIVRDMRSNGVVSPLFEDDDIQEIVCDGIGVPLVVNFKDKRKFNTNVVFETYEIFNNQIMRFSTLSNVSISKDNPFLECKVSNFMIDGNLSTEFFPGKFVIKRI